MNIWSISHKESRKLYSFFLLGTYAPLTMEGNIVVDGVLASCYSGHDHDMAHFAVSPISWVTGLIEGIFNVHNESPGYAKLVDNVSALWFDTWVTILSAWIQIM